MPEDWINTILTPRIVRLRTEIIVVRSKLTQSEFGAPATGADSTTFGGTRALTMAASFARRGKKVGLGVILRPHSTHPEIWSKTNR